MNTKTSKTQIIEMIKMDTEGVSRTEIARHFDLTKGRVSQILNAPENQRTKEEMQQKIQSAINRVATQMKNKIKD